MMNPLVSLIIPVYNGEKIIGSTLKQVLKQTYSNFEVILVNDGSTDNTLDILKKFQREDRRIKIVDKKNGRLLKARLDGVAAAAGVWITFLDADDYLYSNALEVFVLNIEDQVNIIIGSVCPTFDRFGLTRRRPQNIVPSGCIEGVYDVLDQHPFDFDKAFWGKHSIFVSNWAKLYKKDLFLATEDTIKTSIHSFEDTLLNLVLFREAKKIKFIKDRIIDYRYGGGTARVDTSTLKDLNELYLVRKEILRKDYDDEKKRYADCEYINVIYMYFLNAMIIERWSKAKVEEEVFKNKDLPVVIHVKDMMRHYETENAVLLRNMEQVDVFYTVLCRQADGVRFRRQVFRSIGKFLSKL